MIIALVIFCYGLAPVAGAFMIRRSWRIFRRRFDDLRLKPFLDYGIYRRIEGDFRDGPETGDAPGSGNPRPEGIYRFLGGFESLTDGDTLWIRGDELTIPVALAGAQTYLLPMAENTPEFFDPGEEVPERIRWDRVSALTEGAKVFVGGALVLRDDRPVFISTGKTPLLVIFYDGSDRSLTARAIRAGRQRNEYWNPLTPYAFATGAFSLSLMAVSFLSRPAFRFTVIAAFIALFTPLFPLIPPGLLLTVLYRRLWWRARIFRAYRDLARLPLKYIFPGECFGKLPGGELYGALRYESLPPDIPRLIPEDEKRKKDDWYLFGVLSEKARPFAATLNTAGVFQRRRFTPPEYAPPGREYLPSEPQDVFAGYGAVPGNPAILARRYNTRAYVLEVISWFILLAGMSLNIFFIIMIVSLLWR